MNEIKEIVIGLGLIIFALVIWAYKIVITSDVPVDMSSNESILIACMLVLFLILYSFYIRKAKYIRMNSILLLLTPLFLWYVSMQQELIYQYNKYNTLVSIMGFSITLISFVQLIIYWKSKK